MFDANLICVIAGPLIAAAVSAFKRIDLVAAYPKIVVALLSIIVSVVSTLTLGGLDWVLIAQCALVPFVGAVATYEVAKTAVTAATTRTLIGLSLLAFATVAVAHTTQPEVQVSLKLAAPCLAPTDSARLSLSWGSVRDARGEPVAGYAWALVQEASTIEAAAVLASGETPATSSLASIACPQYGDSLVVHAEVFAIDVRGNEGARGMSAPLTLATDDPGPPAPQVQIDTTSVAAVFDTIRTGFVRGAGYTWSEISWDSITTALGDTTKACVYGYREGSGVNLQNEEPMCPEPPPLPGSLWFRVKSNRWAALAPDAAALFGI